MTRSQTDPWLVTRDSRGIAFITTLFVLFALGMMLVGLVFMTQNEAFLAARSRNSAIAFDLADAGLQEALARLSLFTIVPGATTFTASLPTTSSLSSSTVAFQAALTFGGQKLMMYPVTSTATFANTTRVVRAYMLATFKPGMSNVIFTPNLNANADARPVSGDTYSAASINYQSGNVPQCATSPPPGATATNLPSPQVFAGTQIIWQSPGSGCNAGGSGNYTSNDCASDTGLSEVAPTACGGSAGGRFAGLPFNFHPMTPIGMPQADFIEVLNHSVGGTVTGLPGLTIVQATQSGTKLSYPTPTGVGGYPTSGCPGGTCVGDIWLIKTSGLQKQFCVDSTNHTVLAPPCTLGTQKPYGDPTNPVRYLDWGLVLTDTTTAQATTFFQAPSCAAPCPFPGFQNGIRYIPPPPNINVQAKACTVNVNPGTNVVDYYTVANPNCSAPIVTHNIQTETFSGTKSNPESLIILNGLPGGAGTVNINGSIVPGALPGSCNPLSWFDTNANWGQIMATGDLTFGNTFSFAGFLYAGGNITFNSDAAIWGAVVSTNSNTYATLNSTTTFCGGSQVSVLNPTQMNFSQWAWEDRDAMQDPTVPPSGAIR